MNAHALAHCTIFSTNCTNAAPEGLPLNLVQCVVLSSTRSTFLAAECRGQLLPESDHSQIAVLPLATTTTRCAKARFLRPAVEKSYALAQLHVGRASLAGGWRAKASTLARAWCHDTCFTTPWRPATSGSSCFGNSNIGWANEVKTDLVDATAPRNMKVFFVTRNTASSQKRLLVPATDVE